MRQGRQATNPDIADNRGGSGRDQHAAVTGSWAVVGGRGGAGRSWRSARPLRSPAPAVEWLQGCGAGSCRRRQSSGCSRPTALPAPRYRRCPSRLPLRPRATWDAPQDAEYAPAPSLRNSGYLSFVSLSLGRARPAGDISVSGLFRGTLPPRFGTSCAPEPGRGGAGLIRGLLRPSSLVAFREQLGGWDARPDRACASRGARERPRACPGTPGRLLHGPSSPTHLGAEPHGGERRTELRQGVLRDRHPRSTLGRDGGDP